MESSFLRKNRKALIIVFFTALIFRMVFSLPVLFDIERAIGPGSDARNYITLATHILSRYEFSVYGEETGYREAARTPVYPLFVALAYLLSGNRNWFIIISQCVLDALTALLVFSTAIVLLHSIHAALFAGLLYAMHPHQALYTTQILSETLFTFLIAVFMVFLLIFFIRKRMFFLVVSGILLGIAALTRPIAFYFFIPILFVIFIVLRRKYKILLQSSLLFLLSFFLTLSPWYVRNYITFRKVFLTTIGDCNIGYYNAAFVISFKEKIDLREAQFVVEREVKKIYNISDVDYLYASDNPVISKQIASYGYKIIRENPGTYALLHFTGFLHTFLPVEYAFLYKIFSSEGIKKVSEASRVAKRVLNFSLKGRFITSFRIIFTERLKKFPLWFSIIWFSFSLFELFIYFFAIRGLLFFFKNRKVIFLLYLLTLFYFFILPGPVGDPRFRVPVEPIIIVLAAVGLSHNKRIKVEG